MEKYRKFGDASTGIHPFTVVIAPTSWGVVAAAAIFPCRLLLLAIFVLLLFIVDTLAGLLYLLFLGFTSGLLLGPLRRLLVRGLLFCMGHICVAAEEVPADGERRSAAAASATPLQLTAGDVLFANMQSVWDICALEVALGLTYYSVAFPCPVTGAGKATTAAVAKGAPPRWAFQVIGPGPFQRWAVWRQVRRSGTLAFLNAAAAAAETAKQATEIANGSGSAGRSSSSSSALSCAELMDLVPIQCRSRVPVVCFAEATCSNGKGILRMSPMLIRGNRQQVRSGSHSDASAPVVAVAAITYDTPALQNVVSEGEGFFAYALRVCQLVYGTTSPTWSSPFFPTALVQYRRAVQLPGARPGVTAAESALGGHPSSGARRPTQPCAGGVFLLDTASVDALRDALCMKAGGRVAGAGAGGIRRQPLSVGLEEKVGFLETYLAANKTA